MAVIPCNVLSVTAGKSSPGPARCEVRQLRPQMIRNRGRDERVPFRRIVAARPEERTEIAAAGPVQQDSMDSDERCRSAYGFDEFRLRQSSGLSRAFEVRP